MSKPLVKRTSGGISYDYSDVPKIAARLLELEEKEETGAFISFAALRAIEEALDHMLEYPNTRSILINSIKLVMFDVFQLAKKE